MARTKKELTEEEKKAQEVKAKEAQAAAKKRAEEAEAEKQQLITSLRGMLKNPKHRKARMSIKKKLFHLTGDKEVLKS